MKSLGVYLKHYKKESIIAPLFKLLEVVFDLLVPMVVAQIIDVGIAGNNRPYIVGRFGILVLMAAVGLCCSFTAQYFAAKASVGCATELRQAVFDHIQALSFTELDTIGTDTLITRLINDINQVQNGINMGLRLLLRSPFIVFGSVVMAFTVNVKCAIVFLVTIPILFVAVFGIMLVSIPLFKKVQAALDRVTGMTRENLNGVRVIRAFCREEQSVADFEKSNDELTCLNEFVGKISALLNPLLHAPGLYRTEKRRERNKVRDRLCTRCRGGRCGSGTWRKQHHAGLYVSEKQQRITVVFGKNQKLVR